MYYSHRTFLHASSRLHLQSWQFFCLTPLLLNYHCFDSSDEYHEYRVDTWSRYRHEEVE